MSKKSATGGLFRAQFIIGSILAFISLFIEWFYFNISYETGQSLVEGLFHPFSGWQITDYIFLGALEEYYPSGNLLPMELIWFEIGMIFISLIIVLFRNDFRSKSQYEGYFLLSASLITITFANYALLMGFWLEEAYFPFLITINDEIGVTITQGVGLGYILQILSFTLMFPHAWVCLKTFNLFEISTQEKIQAQGLNSSQNGQFLDKLLAEEVALLHGKEVIKTDVPTQEIEHIHKKYQKRGLQ